MANLYHYGKIKTILKYIKINYNKKDTATNTYKQQFYETVEELSNNNDVSTTNVSKI